MRDLPPQALDQRHQQRKKLHGVLLPAISAQVVIDKPEGGRCRWTVRKWKRVFAAGYGITGSTEDLNDDEYAAFVWWVEVQASGRMGVNFPDQRDAAALSAARPSTRSTEWARSNT